MVTLPARAGVFLTEESTLDAAPNLADFSRTYLLGTSTLGDEYVGQAIGIGSSDDFKNLFGSASALTLNNIDFYLQNTTIGLFFVKIKPSHVATVTLVGNTAGTYELIIEGISLSVVIPASPVPTAASVLNKIVTEINNHTSINQLVEAEFLLDNTGTPDYSTSSIRIRSKNGQTFTLTKNGTNITVTAVTLPNTFNYWDYLSAFDRVIQQHGESDLGFLLCPEAYYTLVNQYERTIVANRAEQTARTLKWWHPIDPGNPTIINHPIKAKTDAANATAIKGHSGYYYPYPFDTDQDDISPSIALAAYAMQLYASRGMQEPPAGTEFPLRGVGGLRYTLSNPQKNDLASSKVNILIYKNGIGYVIYDTYTRSTDPKFQMVSARIILNCLEKSIEKTIDSSGILFQSIGSRGSFFIKLRAIIENVVGIYYGKGALFGATPEQAYRVRCDLSVQTPADLQNGTVTALLYVIPAATARQVNTIVYPLTIGNLDNVLAQLGF
jgi:hypothetical protein